MNETRQKRNTEDYELVAIKLFGWRWMRFEGVPVKGTLGYPEKRPVRSFMSPETVKEWRKDSRYKSPETLSWADGTEPLSYSYCSSQGHSWPTLGDIEVREKVEKEWAGSPKLAAFELHLPTMMKYKPGDFIKAAAQVLKGHSRRPGDVISGFGDLHYSLVPSPPKSFLSEDEIKLIETFYKQKRERTEIELPSGLRVPIRHTKMRTGEKFGDTVGRALGCKLTDAQSVVQLGEILEAEVIDAIEEFVSRLDEKDVVYWQNWPLQASFATHPETKDKYAYVDCSGRPGVEGEFKDGPELA